MEIVEENSKVLRQLQPGDLVKFTRETCFHWAVYIGNKKLVHLVGDNGDGIGVNEQHAFSVGGKLFVKASVRVDNFWMVAVGYTASKNNNMDKHLRALSADEIVSRASLKIGPVSYTPVFRSCEDFASWCRYDRENVSQLSMEKENLERSMNLHHNRPQKRVRMEHSLPQDGHWKESTGLCADRVETKDLQQIPSQLKKAVNEYEPVESIPNDVDDWKTVVAVLFFCAFLYFWIDIENLLTLFHRIFHK